MADVDGADPESLRAALVGSLRSKGHLASAAMADAFAAVPRHLFVPDVVVEDAYRDHAIPTKRLASGEVVSSSSQPEIMAIMLEQLDVRPGQRVLEIGAGTGYNAALLARLVGPTGRVTTVDLDDDTVAAARAHLEAAGVTGVRVVCADGWAGVAEGAPYERIILTVGAHDISPAWRRSWRPAAVSSSRCSWPPCRPRWPSTSGTVSWRPSPPAAASSCACAARPPRRCSASSWDRSRRPSCGRARLGGGQQEPSAVA